MCVHFVNHNQIIGEYQLLLTGGMHCNFETINTHCSVGSVGEYYVSAPFSFRVHTKQENAQTTQTHAHALTFYIIYFKHLFS